MFSIRITLVIALYPCLIGAQNIATTILLLYEEHITAIKYASADPEISTECSKQLESYYQSLLVQTPWALQMFDAHTKLPSGILVGNVYDLGNFDECLNIEVENLNGKYCLGTIPVPEGMNLTTMRLTNGGQVRMLGNDPKYTGFHISVCMPNKCSANDASKIYPFQKFSEKYCYSKDTQQELSAGAITTISILSIILAIVILSTCYDIYLYYNNYKPGKDITIAFSCFTNGKKLITPSSNSDQMLCLHGIKAISMMWIVMVHEYVNGSAGAVANYPKIIDFVKSTANMFVIGSTVAVDTFFVIGGLVTVYTFLKAADKGLKFNILLYYIHRYIRLTPAFAIVVLIHATLLEYLGNGPLWNGFNDHLVESCRKHFWAALLYIQNYVHDEQTCVPQSWYLSIDMQLFILSPVVLLPLKYKPKWTLVGLVLLSLAGIIVPFFVAFYEELYAFLNGDKETTQKYMFSYYEQTYGRFGAYVIGMILGYIVYKIKNRSIKIKLKWMWVLSLWTICLAGGLACVYAGHDIMVSEYNKWSHSLYIAFNRPAWSLAISGIIFLCVSGYGGPIDAFLSANILQFLSKISYSIYLIHYELILIRAYSYKTEYIVEDFYVFFNFWGDFVFSSILAVILCLSLESPMITIEKLLFGAGQIENRTRSKLNA